MLKILIYCITSIGLMPLFIISIIASGEKFFEKRFLNKEFVDSKSIILNKHAFFSIGDLEVSFRIGIWPLILFLMAIIFVITAFILLDIKQK